MLLKGKGNGANADDTPVDLSFSFLPVKVANIKIADEAIGILKHTLELQEAGVIGVELEVVPPKVAEVITKS